MFKRHIIKKVSSEAEEEVITTQDIQSHDTGKVGNKMKGVA